LHPFFLDILSSTIVSFRAVRKRKTKEVEIEGLRWCIVVGMTEEIVWEDGALSGVE